VLALVVAWVALDALVEVEALAEVEVGVDALVEV